MPTASQLELSALAQAQSLFFEKAVMDKMTPANLARLAQHTADLYAKAAQACGSLGSAASLLQWGTRLLFQVCAPARAHSAPPSAPARAPRRPTLSSVRRAMLSGTYFSPRPTSHPAVTRTLIPAPLLRGHRQLLAGAGAARGAPACARAR